MLEHLASRSDFSSHMSIETRAEIAHDNSIRSDTITYAFRPSPGRHLLWNNYWPIWIERTREKPTASNEPYETIIIETFQKSKADGRERMQKLIDQARIEAASKMEENSTLQIYGNNGQEWSVLSTQPRRGIDSVILDPGEAERIFTDMKVGLIQLLVV